MSYLFTCKQYASVHKLYQTIRMCSRVVPNNTHVFKSCTKRYACVQELYQTIHMCSGVVPNNTRVQELYQTIHNVMCSGVVPNDTHVFRSCTKRYTCVQELYQTIHVFRSCTKRYTMSCVQELYQTIHMCSGVVPNDTHVFTSCTLINVSFGS